jgi:hypothetical protein
MVRARYSCIRRREAVAEAMVCLGGVGFLVISGDEVFVVGLDSVVYYSKVGI